MILITLIIKWPHLAYMIYKVLSHRKGSCYSPSIDVKTKVKGFPGGAVVESLPADAGDTGLSSWSGRIPHAAEQLGP